MTCKHLYMHLACLRPEWIVEKDGMRYYPICDYHDRDETDCPYYEEKNE